MKEAPLVCKILRAEPHHDSNASGGSDSSHSTVCFLQLACTADDQNGIRKSAYSTFTRSHMYTPQTTYQPHRRRGVKGIETLLAPQVPHQELSNTTEFAGDHLYNNYHAF